MNFLRKKLPKGRGVYRFDMSVSHKCDATSNLTTRTVDRGQVRVSLGSMYVCADKLPSVD